jgi:acetyl-CoA acyltransferase
VKALIERTGIDPATLEDVLLGVAYPEASQGNNIARIAGLLAGLPIEVGGMTVNRFCGSSMSAIHIAAGQIAIGAGEAFVAGGVESMTMVPQGGLQLLAQSHDDGSLHRHGPDGRERGRPLRRLARGPGPPGAPLPAEGRRGQAAGRLKDEIAGVMTRPALWTSTAACAPPRPWRAWRL